MKDHHDTQDYGRILLASAENVRRALREVDLIKIGLEEMIEARLAETMDLLTDGWEKAMDEGDNCITDFYWDCSLKKKLKGKPHGGYIGLNIRICGDDDEGESSRPDWPWLDQACLMVCWHPTSHKNEAGPEDFEPDVEMSRALITRLGGGLWSYGSDPAAYYFFVLPLGVLTGREAFKEFCVDPLLALHQEPDPRGTNHLAQVPALE